LGGAADGGGRSREERSSGVGGLRRDREPGLDAVEILRELFRRLVAVFRGFCQGAEHDLVELGRNLGPDLGGRLRQLVQVLHGDLDRGVTAEGHLAGQHLVEHDPDGVEIRRRGHRRAAGLLGREVLRSPHDRPGLRHLRGARPGDPEVGDLEPLATDEDVVRLDVAVDDPVTVREAERVENLERVRDRLRDGERAAGEDELLEAAALDHLHGDVVRALCFAAVVDRDDVRVRERCGRLRLAPEALDEELVVRVAVVEDLDRDAAAELLVLGQIDIRHAPGAQLAQDAVAPVEERVDQRVGYGHLRVRLGISPQDRFHDRLGDRRGG
jgi:hypothetical protein